MLRENWFNIANHKYIQRGTWGLSRNILAGTCFQSKTNLIENPTVTISFDIDYEKDVLAIPTVIETLSKYDIVASFACVGIWVDKYKSIHRMILQEGHEILNHSYSHPDNEELNLKRFSYIKPQERYKEIEKGHQILEDVTGSKIEGFRTPHFGNQHVYDVYNYLHQLGYTFSSSMLTNAFSKGCSVWLEPQNNILEFSLACVPGKPWAAFDSWNYFNKQYPLTSKGRTVEEDFNRLMDTALNKGNYINFYFDPGDFVKRKEYQQICAIVKDYINEKAYCLENYKSLAEKIKRIK